MIDSDRARQVGLARLRGAWQKTRAPRHWSLHDGRSPFITLEVHGVMDADPLGNEPIFATDGKLVGRATSGYYGHCLRKSLAIGYVKPEFAAVGTEVTVGVLGERKRATVLVDSPYDPQNLQLRA